MCAELYLTQMLNALTCKRIVHIFSDKHFVTVFYYSYKVTYYVNVKGYPGITEILTFLIVLQLKAHKVSKIASVSFISFKGM
jgi:hypothetical protein